MTSRIADPARWRAGRDRLDWAAEFMPVTAALGEELATAGTVAGLRIGVSDVLEPKTANLALTLARAGASVVVCCVGRDTDDEVAAALHHEGIPVYADSRATEAEDRANVLALLDHLPQVIVDDGSGTIRLAHATRPEVLAGVIGATEQTTSGVRPLRVMQRQGVLRVPVVAANDARTKSWFDNAHGTGQTVVLAVVDLLGEPLAGAEVVVAGFGPVGSGVARHAAALGATVTVTEVDPVAALQARFAGYRVDTLRSAAARADVLVSATGVAGTVGVDDLLALPDGAAVAVAGGVWQEVELEQARARGARETGRSGRVSALTLPGGTTVRVLDDGHCLNVSAAEGNPVQVMDLSFGVQLAAVEHLVTHRETLTIGVHRLPDEADRRVAALALAAFGGALDTPTPRQQESLEAWLPRPAPTAPAAAGTDAASDP